MSKNTNNAAPTKTPQVRHYPGWCVWAIAWASNVTSLIPMHPPDVVKVRCMLVSKQGQQQGKFLALTVAKNIYKQSGVLGFYDGLSAAIGRSTIYGNIKLAGYELLRDAIERKTNKEATAVQRLACGIASGSLGSFMACPVEVALVRMQADRRLQPELRRGYKHVFDAVWRIGKEEGVLTYWRGSTPTITRGVVVAVAQVATYDQFKSVLVKNGYMKDGFGLFVVCSILSGLCYAYLSMPVETVKILMQEQKPRADGSLEYRGMIQSMVHEVRKEGVLRLWRGFGAYWARCGTGTIGLFLAQEQYRRLFNWIYAPKV